MQCFSIDEVKSWRFRLQALTWSKDALHARLYLITTCASHLSGGDAQVARLYKMRFFE